MAAEQGQPWAFPTRFKELQQKHSQLSESASVPLWPKHHHVMSPWCRDREGGRWEGAKDLEDWRLRFKEAGLPQKRGFSPVHVGVLTAQHFYVSRNFFLVICFMIIQQLDKIASQATLEAMYKNQPCLFVLLKKSIPALFFRPALKQHSAISKNLKSTLKASTLAPLELLAKKEEDLGSGRIIYRCLRGTIYRRWQPTLH